MQQQPRKFHGHLIFHFYWPVVQQPAIIREILFRLRFRRNLTVGTITQNVSVSDTVINVSQSVIDSIAIGFYASITDGTHTDDLGRVTAVSTANKTITVETASTNAYLAATPTTVAMTVSPVHNFEFGPPQSYNIGQSSLGASHVPANIPLVLKYTNNGGTTKTLIFNYEYLY